MLQTALVATSTAVTCEVSITVRANGEMLSSATGGGRVDSLGADAERDCVGAVIEDLIAKTLVVTRP